MADLSRKPTASDLLLFLGHVKKKVSIIANIELIGKIIMTHQLAKAFWHIFSLLHVFVCLCVRAWGRGAHGLVNKDSDVEISSALWCIILSVQIIIVSYRIIVIILHG